MARLAFIASAIVVAGAAAHGNAHHASEGFEYVGCVKADSTSFPMVVDFFAPFTPEQCQTACGSATYAAIRGGCYCDAPGLGDVDYEVVDDSKCDTLCIDGEEDKGYCGGDGVWSLFKKADDEECDEDDEDDEDEDCEEEETSTSLYTPTSTTFHGGHYSTKTETNTYTVTSCPPEVSDCPHKSKTVYTLTETNTYTISSCPDDVPDCPYKSSTYTKPTYTHPPAPSCDGNCPDKTTLVPSVTPCVGCGGEEETETPTKPPVVTAAAGQNAPVMGAVALGALFVGMM